MSEDEIDKRTSASCTGCCAAEARPQSEESQGREEGGPGQEAKRALITTGQSECHVGLRTIGGAWSLFNGATKSGGMQFVSFYFTSLM
jgi:hypothetical protein